MIYHGYSLDCDECVEWFDLSRINFKSLDALIESAAGAGWMVDPAFLCPKCRAKCYPPVPPAKVEEAKPCAGCDDRRVVSTLTSTDWCPKCRPAPSPAVAEEAGKAFGYCACGHSSADHFFDAPNACNHGYPCRCAGFNSDEFPPAPVADAAQEKKP